MAIGTPAKKIDVLNSEEFMQVYNSLYENAKKYDPKGYEEGKYANRNLLQIIRTCLMQMGNLYMIQIGKMRHMNRYFP